MQPHKKMLNIIITVLCLVAQSCLSLCDPMNCSLPGSSVHGDSPGKNREMQIKTTVRYHLILVGMAVIKTDSK